MSLSLDFQPFIEISPSIIRFIGISAAIGIPSITFLAFLASKKRRH